MNRTRQIVLRRIDRSWNVADPECFQCSLGRTDESEKDNIFKDINNTLYRLQIIV